MLEDFLKEIKEINKNLERIAENLETNNVKAKRKVKKEVDETFENNETQVATKDVTEPQIPTEIQPSPQPVQTNTAVESNVQVNPVTPQNIIPVNATPETYTFDEIARAMGAAMEVKGQDFIFGILSTFGASNLMNVDPSKYSDIARMLREAGIKI